MLLVAQTKDSLTLENAEQIVDYANEVMRFDPFSPGNLNFLIYGTARSATRCRNRSITTACR